MTDNGMSVGKAIGIFSNINEDKYSDAEKARAIYIIMNRSVHKGEVVKEDMMEVIKWLWHRQFRVRKNNDNNNQN